MRALPIALACAIGALGACKDDSSDAATERQPAATDDAAASGDEAATVEDAAAARRAQPVVLAPAPPVPPAPLGLPKTPSPDHNRTTPAKVALGELLFFDPRLSIDGSMSCASCHQPEHGWAAPEPRSETVAGKPNLRHTPSLYNVAHARHYFWDGRTDSLEATVLSHWKGQLGADPASGAAALGAVPAYRAHFERAFGEAPEADLVAEALAAFVRTLRSGDSPWDRYEAGDEDAVDPEAAAGFRVFSEKAQCALCHPPPLYSDYGYHDLGVGAGDGPDDPGRYRVTGKKGDRGAFKTPTLRSVTASPPYFHDGSAATLEEAVDVVLQAGSGLHPRLSAMDLDAEQRRQLLAFLRALTPETEAHRPPDLP